MKSPKGRASFPLIEVKMNNSSRLRNMSQKQSQQEQEDNERNKKDDNFSNNKTTNNVNIRRSESLNSTQSADFGRIWKKELDDTLQEEEAELSENRSNRTNKTKNNICNNSVRIKNNNGHRQFDGSQNQPQNAGGTDTLTGSRTPSPKKQLTNQSSFSSSSVLEENEKAVQSRQDINDYVSTSEDLHNNQNISNNVIGNKFGASNKLPHIDSNGAPQGSLPNLRSSLTENSTDRNREFKERARKYSEIQKQKQMSSTLQPRLSLPSALLATNSSNRTVEKLPHIQTNNDDDDKKQQQQQSQRNSHLSGIVSVVSSWNGGEKYPMKVQLSMHQVFTFHCPPIVNRVGLFKPQPELCDSGYERLIFKTGELVYFLGKVTMAELGVDGGFLSSPFQIEAGLFLWLEGLEGSMLKYTKSLLTILELPLISCKYISAPPIIQVFPVKRTKREWMSIVHSGKFPPPQLLDTNVQCQSSNQQLSNHTHPTTSNPDNQSQPRTHAQTARNADSSQKKKILDGSLSERSTGRKSAIGNSSGASSSVNQRNQPTSNDTKNKSNAQPELAITHIRVNITPIIEKFKASRSKNKPTLFSSQFQSSMQTTFGSQTDANNNNATLPINPSADDRLLLWLRMDPSLKLTTSIQFYPPTIYYQKIKGKTS